MSNSLTAITPLDGRYKAYTEELAEYFSEFALIKSRLQVELKYLRALSELGLFKGVIPSIEFDINLAKQVKEIELTTKHDVKAIEYFLRSKLKESLHKWIHFGLTSEDVNNLSYGIMIKTAKDEKYVKQAEKILLLLSQLKDKYADLPLLAKTHGQAAIPTTFGKEMAVYYHRLNSQLKLLKSQKLGGKINGAVGNYNALYLAFPKIDWIRFSIKFVKSFGLEPVLLTTQIEPKDKLAEVCDTIRRINSILLDLCKDMWLYISNGTIKQKSIANEVGSSTMPQKINPIYFENAEGNLGISSTLFVHLSEKLMQSRLQRDLSDSTATRNIGVAFAHSYLALNSMIEGFKRIEPNSEHMENELNMHKEVLSEAIQTIMRVDSIPNAYEKTKQLFRGNNPSTQDVELWLKSSGLSEFRQNQIKNLKPKDYIGLAPKLARLK